uniref:Protein kinase domain-containing protein n=1 Tax=Rhabditophanes sp. KR3021 TaxID=114890 RepID=A0AC35UEQ0_9BILA
MPGIINSWEGESEHILQEPRIITEEQETVKVTVGTELDRRKNHKYGENQLLLVALTDWISSVYPKQAGKALKNFLIQWLQSNNFIDSNFEVGKVTEFTSILKQQLMGNFQKAFQIETLFPTVDHAITTLNTINYSSHCKCRYENDFAELNVIGRGAYGKVSRVRNYCDGKEYAIKQVHIENREESCKEALQEVTHLSRLEHPSIVRYYQAWIEDQEVVRRRHRLSTSVPQIEEVCDSEEEDFDENSSSRDGDGTSKTDNSVYEDFETNNENQSSQSIVFEHSNGNKTAESSTEGDNQSDGKFFRKPPPGKSSSNFSSFGSTVESIGTRHSKKQLILKSKFIEEEKYPTIRPVLYIQMELLTSTLAAKLQDHNFLKLPIRERNDFNLEVFRSMMSALAYIHSQNMIHRDIKPSNILLKQEERGKWIIKLGDFGLARTFESKLIGEEHEKMLAEEGEDDYTRGVGTKMYSAPEQSNSTNYGPEVDMYSLGLVLFEMLNDFHTRSETIHAFESLRTTEKVPEKFKKDHKNEISILIERMVSRNPKLRPTARQILSESSSTYPKNGRKRDPISSISKFMGYDEEKQQMVLMLYLKDMRNKHNEEKEKWNEEKMALEERIKSLESKLLENETNNVLDKLTKE